MHGSIKARICTTAVPYILACKAPYFTRAKNTSDADNHHGRYIQDLGLYTIIITAKLFVFTGILLLFFIFT
jgi:hypothetical protein